MRSDKLGRKTIYELLPDWALVMGGCLSVVLIWSPREFCSFTTDGQIGNTLTKPGGCVKIYDIWVRGHVSDEHIAQALKGVQSKSEILKALSVEKIGTGGAKTKLRVQIDEGRNRHILRLFGKLKDQKFGTSLKVLELG